ncbi:hypothetical protein [Mycobacterium malmoense]|nr:hypothetical protein [Mycobacterium malmoense]
MIICLPTQPAAPARPAIPILVMAALAVRGGHHNGLSRAYW